MRYANVIKAMLVPGRLFSVEGLCRMSHVPDIGGTLENLEWIEHTPQGTKWVGPVPKNEEEEGKLFAVVENAAGESPEATATRAEEMHYARKYQQERGIGIVVPPEAKKRLTELAKADGRTLASYTREVVLAYIAALDK